MMRPLIGTRSQMYANHLIAIVALVVPLVIADLALHYIAPVQLSTVGHRDAANARFYGWGFDPGEQVRLRDPDTGDTFKASVNKRGWRDLDREAAKPPGTFRVLALGDSNTFGVLVPADETWTRILERKLRAQGWNAEVLNLAYPQWGTDQELEALRREGVLYNPDLVILQFTINDLTDNTEVLRTSGSSKPFHYRLTGEGSLERIENPTFVPIVARDTLHGAAAHSEILKRAYFAWTNVKALLQPKYFVYPQSLDQLKVVLQFADNDPLLLALSTRLGSGLSEHELQDVVERYGRSQDRQTVLRVLENEPFKPFWLPMQYDPMPPDLQRDDWRLLLRLIEEVRSTAASIDADTAILSDQEEGFYDWERYWLRIGPGPEIKRKFLEPTAAVHAFATEHGIGFIDNLQKHVRARNDSHPNREGTEAMANNAYAYVVDHYRDRLDRSR